MRRKGTDEGLRRAPLPIFVPGLISGLGTAGAFSPWDRALYLSALNSRRFLSRENFVHPWQGFSQTMVQRTVSGGLYFMLRDGVASSLPADTPHFVIGTLAGAANGLLLNPMAAVKYFMWASTEQYAEAAAAEAAAAVTNLARTGATPATEAAAAAAAADARRAAARGVGGVRGAGGGAGAPPRTFAASATALMRSGGARALLTGSTATIQRDMLFGSVYEVLRHRLHRALVARDDGSASSSSSSSSSSSASSSSVRQPEERAGMLANAVAAAGATAASAPLNYARNVKYAYAATDPVVALRPPAARAAPPHTPAVLASLYAEAVTAGRSAGGGVAGTCAALTHVQRRLRIGWGTLRVGVGMAAGQYLFNASQEALAPARRAGDDDD